MINPQYPVYIISKGRAKYRHTSKSLERMKVPYHIVIEEQEYDQYAEHIDPEKILVLPFSNMGSSTPARNWCWEHSISLGAKRHWIMDDNIRDFYRLHQNQRIRVESGVIFKVVEDFVDRFENVWVSGLQYRFFARQDMKWPAIGINRRVFSCLLIDNSCPLRWRGKYNEDVDLCIRVLKEGYCTVLFNAFLQDKIETQVMGGGNTDEFYAKEGTYEKSKMLYDLHPDVTKIVWRFDRWHHEVDFDKLKRNQLKYREGIVIPEGVNEYGMKLIDNFDEYQKNS